MKIIKNNIILKHAKLAEVIIMLKNSKTYNIQKNKVLQQGSLPVITQEKKFISGYTNDTSKCLNANQSNPFIVFGDHSLTVKFINFPFVIGADGTQVFYTKDEIINKYLYYIILNKKFINSEGYRRHFSILKNKIIKYPSITQQQYIINILSKQEEQIETIKRLIKNVEKRNQYYSEKLLSGELRLRKNEETGQVEFYENTEWKEEMVNGVLTKIPFDWEVTLIKNIIPLTKGTSIHSSELNNLSVGLPYLRTNELWDGSSVNKDKIYFNGDSSTMVKKTINEYIVCFDGFNKEPYKGTLGMVTNNGEGICSGELHKISELQNISKYFVNVMLLKNNRFQLTICRSGEGTTVKHAGKHFKHIEELLIPYKEQELLNDLFKEQLSDIDRLKTLLPKEEKRFQWMLDNLLSGEYEVIDED